MRLATPPHPPRHRGGGHRAARRLRSTRGLVAACLLAAVGGTGLAQGATASDPFAAVAAPSRAAQAGGAATHPDPAPATTPRPTVRRALTVRHGTVTLAGSLLAPAGPGPYPAVVLLAGSTPAERQRAETDARLFADSGVASFRYTVVGDPVPSTGWRTALNVDDAIGDAVAAVAAVRRQPGIDPSRVGVWGVGQGAWLAPFVGEHADVAFLILLNTSAAPLGQEEVWRAGDAVRARGYSATAADTAMRSVRLLVATRPVLAALLPPGQLGFLGADPGRTPTDALARAQAPALLVFDDLDPHAPGVKSTAALLRTAQTRDQPLDHVTVIGRAADAAPDARRASEATYRSVVLGWTATVVGTAGRAGGTAASAGTAPALASSATTSSATAPAGTTATPGGPDPSLQIPGTTDLRAPWYASPWVQLGAVVFFLIAFGEGLVLSVLPHRGRRAASTSDGPHAARTARLLHLTQALVSLVDLALLVGSTLAIAFLLGLYSPRGLALEPLALGLRALSAVSGTLAVGLAVLLLLARRNGALPPRPAVAVVVAVAAALFLPFLVYWHVPFLAG